MKVSPEFEAGATAIAAGVILGLMATVFCWALRVPGIVGGFVAGAGTGYVYFRLRAKLKKSSS